MKIILALQLFCKSETMLEKLVYSFTKTVLDVNLNSSEDFSAMSRNKEQSAVHGFEEKRV